MPPELVLPTMRGHRSTMLNQPSMLSRCSGRRVRQVWQGLSSESVAGSRLEFLYCTIPAHVKGVEVSTARGVWPLLYLLCLSLVPILQDNFPVNL
jgi:hypothetical protein